MASDPGTKRNITAAFRFVVSLDGVAIGAFIECTLPVLEWEIEEVKEGGLNTYIHQLPGRRKSAKITLKNGIGITKELSKWFTPTPNQGFKPRKVTITLYDISHKPMMVWSIEKAYPVRWTGPQLKADENTVAIQTFELTCGEIKVEEL